MSRFKKKSKQRIVLILLASLLGLELIFRVAGVEPHIPVFNPGGPFRTHPNLRFAFKPNYEGQWSGVNIKINSLGLRSEEIPLQKPEGEKRVLVLGGSVSAGNGVAFEEIFPTQLARQLNNALSASDQKVTVINSGVPGYATIQQIKFLKQPGLDLSPDMIILDFAINDMLEGKMDYTGMGVEPVFRAKNVFLYLDTTLSGRERFVRFLKNIPRYTSSHRVGLWMKKKVYAALYPQENLNVHRWIEQQLLNEEPSEVVLKAWQKTQVELLELQAIAKAQNIPLLLVTFPLNDQIQVESGLDRPQRLLREFCQAQGITFVDLLPEYRQSFQNNPQMKIFKDADHPTAYGHELAAQALERAIKPLLQSSYQTAELVNY